MKFLERPTRTCFSLAKEALAKRRLPALRRYALPTKVSEFCWSLPIQRQISMKCSAQRLGNHPTPVTSVPGLFAMNLDPEVAAAEYRERMVGPYRDVLPKAAVASIEEQLSGSCTLEIAAFDEFSKLLGNASATAEFDHVIFDTAPTGHTLRLLTLPSAWSGFMETNTTGTSCLGPLAGLQGQQKLYQETVRALGDPATTTLVLVTRPEVTALREADRTSRELAELGVHNQHLVVNGVFRASDKNDRYAQALERRGENALGQVPDQLRELPRTLVPLAMSGMLGIDALRMLGDAPAVGSRTPGDKC